MMLIEVISSPDPAVSIRRRFAWPLEAADLLEWVHGQLLAWGEGAGDLRIERMSEPKPDRPKALGE